MKLINKLSFLVISALVFAISGCDKSKLYDVTVAPSQAHFVGEKIQAYPVRANPVAVYEVIVGTTDVAAFDREVTFNVTSPTGAAAGVQYTLGTTGNKVIIKGGKALATIPVQGILAGFPALRIDTLVFTLKIPSLKPSIFFDTVKLAIGDICGEANPFSINSFLGAYANTIETFGTGAPYGPYTTGIASITPLTSTTATIVVTNIWDNGWGPISFTLDWSNPLSKTAKVIAQAAIPGSNAGDLNAIYAGQTVAVRPFATGNLGSFLSCTGTLSLKMQLGVTGVGYFAGVYTVNMKR